MQNNLQIASAFSRFTDQTVNLMVAKPLWRALGNCFLNNQRDTHVGKIALAYLLVSPVLVPANILIFSSIAFVRAVPEIIENALESVARGVMLVAAVVILLGSAFKD